MLFWCLHAARSFSLGQTLPPAGSSASPGWHSPREAHHPQRASKRQALQSVNSSHGGEAMQRLKSYASHLPSSGPNLSPATHFSSVEHQPHPSNAVHSPQPFAFLHALVQGALMESRKALRRDETSCASSSSCSLRRLRALTVTAASATTMRQALAGPCRCTAIA